MVDLGHLCTQHHSGTRMGAIMTTILISAHMDTSARMGIHGQNQADRRVGVVGLTRK